MNHKEIVNETNRTLLPEVKKWNQNRLFLVWGFSSAMMATSGLEIFKEIVNDSPIYIVSLIIFFIFFFIVTWSAGRLIDDKSETLQKTYNTLSNKKNLIKK